MIPAMIESHFTAPIISTEIMSVGDLPEGVVSMSLLVKDANQRLFSLHVATSANLKAMKAESDAQGSDGPLEPVYEVIADSLTPDMVEQILQQDPTVLRPYLVAQDEDMPDPAAVAASQDAA